MQTINPLTDRQQKVLDFIRESIQDRGYSPTLREIGHCMGIRSTNGVNDHLRALERKGYLTREDMKSRTLRLTEKALDDSSPALPEPVDLNQVRAARAVAKHGTQPVQLDQSTDADWIEIPILGRVAAGLPAEAIEHAEDSVKVDRMLVGGAKDVFGLRIRGESMIMAGIHDGDYVFVRKQIEAPRGSVVVAMVGDEATCKYFFPEGDHIRLEPANPSMGPIIVHRSDWRDTQILGMVVGVYRKLN